MRHSQTSTGENRTYRVGLEAVRVETTPTGDESVYLFLEFTIVSAPSLNPV